MNPDKLFYGQARQDKFVANVLKDKSNGYFLEIGSSHPIKINNTYVLETEYNWKGIMVEYSNEWLDLYKDFRKNSIHIIQDARTIDYKTLFEENNVPHNIDYLQIDLEVYNGSTYKTLEKLDNEVLDNYKFATVTFEHDIYNFPNNHYRRFSNNFKYTRILSRDIFKRRGYVCVFEDVGDKNYRNPYEDWYVHPDLVDMNYIRNLKEKNKDNYIQYHIEGITDKIISWKSIEYL